MSIGGLEHQFIQEEVEKQLVEFLPVVTHSFKFIDGQCMLIVSLPIQMIPEVIDSLIQQKLAIFEVTKFSE
ncbi:hypothetical protein [Myroides pelagicus]|nr:hypothetical protein [Myroides pelagicus]